MSNDLTPAADTIILDRFAKPRDALRRRFDGLVRRFRSRDLPVSIFAFGSLIFRPEPGMTPVGPALAPGATKTFSVVDRVFRGSATLPGRTLGLVQSNTDAAAGMIFEVTSDVGLDRLFERESAAAYTVDLIDTLDPISGRRFEALAFMVDPLSEDFVREGLRERAGIISRAKGGAGTNLAYFEMTIRAEEALGLGVSSELSQIQRCFAAV